MDNIDYNYYHKIIKFILYDNCELYVEYEKKEASLCRGKSSKPIDYSIVIVLLNDDRIELDSGDYHFNTETYRRTEDWKEHIIDLKQKFPQFFRKEKIKNLLK